jgi:hypothetical protein
MTHLNHTRLICLECGKRLSLKKMGRTTKRHFETAHAGLNYEHGYAQILRHGQKLSKKFFY